MARRRLLDAVRENPDLVPAEKETVVRFAKAGGHAGVVARIGGEGRG